MMVAGRFRRSPVSRPVPIDRLDELLRDWGDWVREYRPARSVGRIDEPVAFAASRALYVYFEEMLAAADRERLRVIDSAINELMTAQNIVRWHLIHWHYAHRSRDTPAVWRYKGLPEHESAEYNRLLDEGRELVRAALIRRRQRHLLEN